MKLFTTQDSSNIITSYGSEAWWVAEAENTTKLQSAEMEFLRSIKGCTETDKTRNDEIRKRLEIYLI
jgi:hypothetical protein